MYHESESENVSRSVMFNFLRPPGLDCSLPGSSVHGILQARILEWVACPPPADLSDPGIKPGSPAFQADSLLSGPLGKPIVRGLFQVYMEVSLGSIYSWPGDFAYLFPERHDK